MPCAGASLLLTGRALEPPERRRKEK
jgi:hypothetical protein